MQGTQLVVHLTHPHIYTAGYELIGRRLPSSSLMLMLKGRQQRGLTLFLSFFGVLETRGSAELRGYDFSSTWTPLLSVSLFSLIKHQILYSSASMPRCTAPHFLPISPSLSSSPALHFPPLSPRSVAQFFRLHAPISVPTTSTLHSLLRSTFLKIFHLLYPSLLLPVSPTLLLFLHTYKSHMEGLLLISPCLGLHLFCLSRDPTMQFPEPRTHWVQI